MATESLKQMRMDRGWSLAHLSSKVGVAASTVSDWERGLAKPQPRHRKVLAAKLGVPISTINEIFPWNSARSSAA